MSDSNRAAILYAEEAAWAETPDQTQTFRYLPFNTESLKHNKETVESERIRSDAQGDASVEVGVGAAGAITSELSAQNFDIFLKHALRAASIVEVNLVAELCTIVQGPGTITADAGTPFTVAMQGAKFIRITGSTGGNNGVKRVISMTSTQIIVPPSELEINDPSVSLGIDCKYMFNGTTHYSSLMEKELLDVSKKIHYIGMTVPEISFDLQAKSKAMITLNFLGRNGVFGFGGNQSVTSGDGTPDADYGEPVMNTSSDVGTVLVDGVAAPEDIRSINLTIANGMRERPKIGDSFSKEPGSGRCRITGSLETYFETGAAYAKFIDHLDSALTIPLTDSDGNFMGISIFALKYDDTNPDNPGEDQDVMLPIDFSAHKHTTVNKMIQFDLLQA